MLLHMAGAAQDVCRVDRRRPGRSPMSWKIVVGPRGSTTLTWEVVPAVQYLRSLRRNSASP